MNNIDELSLLCRLFGIVLGHVVHIILEELEINGMVLIITFSLKLKVGLSIGYRLYVLMRILAMIVSIVKSLKKSRSIE